jgi:type III secretory pathway component EscR
MSANVSAKRRVKERNRKAVEVQVPVVAEAAYEDFEVQQYQQQQQHRQRRQHHHQHLHQYQQQQHQRHREVDAADETPLHRRFLRRPVKTTEKMPTERKTKRVVTTTAASQVKGDKAVVVVVDERGTDLTASFCISFYFVPHTRVVLNHLLPSL